MVQTLTVLDPVSDLARLEGVPSAIEAALAAVDLALGDRNHHGTDHDQTVQALLGAARASARLTDDPERWLPGVVRLYTELTALSALVRIAPGQVLARAHALAARDLVSVENLGRPRPDAAVAARLEGLQQLLTTRTEASAVLVGAIAHAEIAVVEPFGVGDGVVARAVEHMVLISAGVDPYGLISCEAGHLARREGYRSALLGYRDGGAPGVRDWLMHCAAALADGAAAIAPAHRESP
jgi:hypothetical protein